MHKQPEEVFTPRANKVNIDMYVARDRLERRLVNALKSKRYIVIHGESGNGKTWLYKKVFDQIGCHFEVINLANFHQYGSIEKTLEK
jgi:predicted ATPase